MTIAFAGQCCDAETYLRIGKACATTAASCWTPLRPIGAALYFSVPYRLGLPPETLVVMNLLLVAASIVGCWRAFSVLCAKATVVGRLVPAGIAVLAHLFFMAVPAWNSLSDVPAAALALLGIWLLILGGARRRVWYHATAGSALGAAVLVRASYLYPAFLAAAVCLAASVVLKRQRRSALALFLALGVSVGVQFYATHGRTGEWSFLDRTTTGRWERRHFGSTMYGRDTLLPGSAAEYTAPECFRTARDPFDAVRAHDWAAIACLWTRRQEFYFGSYVSAGRVYLSSRSKRHFSEGFLFLNGAALLLGAFFAFSAHRRKSTSVPLVLVATIWAQATAIVPESRFLMVPHVVLWVLALSAISELASQHNPWREDRPISSSDAT